MPVIDFRARPNTVEFLRDYTGPARARMWQRFGHPEPPVGTVEGFIASLDELDIERVVCTGRQVVDDGRIVAGVSNDYVAEVAASFPDRVTGFASVDPTSGTAAVEELRRAISSLGLRGLSLDPLNVRQPPDDQLYYPLYEAASSFGVPVVLTLGPIAGRFGHPWAIDQVAEDFPNLTLVCSHGCWPQVTEFVALAFRRDNVYLEASIYEFHPGAGPFIDAAAGILQDKVVYASAYPFNPLEILHRFRALGFEPEVLHKLVHRNAARILGLDAAPAPESRGAGRSRSADRD